MLNAKGLKYADLGIAPCRLYYRRRVIDMPLSDIPAGTPDKRADALRQARVKIVDKAQRKFLFEFHELRAPGKVIVENGAMAGLNFNRTEVTGSQVKTVEEGVEDARAQLTISSIGSIPQPIPGIPQKGVLYLRRSEDRPADGRLDRRVRGRKRALTGKGNIKGCQSGTEIGMRVAEAYLGLSNEKLDLAEGTRKQAAASAEKIACAMSVRPKIAPEGVASLLRRVRERQRAVGYEGSFRAWLAKVTPADLQ